MQWYGFATVVCLVYELICLICALKGHLLFEVNTKYVSKNVWKISVISRVRGTSEIADILNTFDEIFFISTEKK